jgi:hypothetical protein
LKAGGEEQAGSRAALALSEGRGVLNPPVPWPEEALHGEVGLNGKNGGAARFEKEGRSEGSEWKRGKTPRRLPHPIYTASGPSARALVEKRRPACAGGSSSEEDNIPGSLTSGPHRLTLDQIFNHSVDTI